MSERIEGKIGIVTGASMGIGEGIAKRLIEEGAKVMVVDMKPPTWVLPSDKASFVECDVSSEEAVKKAIQATLTKYSKLDIIVNNAGIYPFKLLTEMTVGDFDRVMAINMRSVFLFTKYGSEAMKAGGRIINISSLAAIQGFVQLTHYCASKGAVNAFTRAAALELAPKGITVNAVLPGAIMTPGTMQTLSDENIAQTFLAVIPLKRFGKTEDIANLVAYLVSDEASYMTGQNIIIDGGWSIQ